MPNGSVTIRDVGPRDGFQNEHGLIPTDLKIHLIDEVAAAGIPAIEVTSFVNSKVVPQFFDADDVARTFAGRPDFIPWAFAGNARGLERAVDCGMTSITTALTVSDALNQSNFRRTTAEMLKTIPELVQRAAGHGVALEVTVGTAFGDTDGRVVGLEDSLGVIREVVGLGATTIMLGDTVGVANPRRVIDTYGPLVAEFPTIEFGAHFHDTRGMGVANALAAWQTGIRRFDASFGGLGGCPFAPGATGNVATEELVYMFDGLGVETGVNIVALVHAAQAAATFLQKDLPSDVARALRAAQAPK